MFVNLLYRVDLNNTGRVLDEVTGTMAKNRQNLLQSNQAPNMSDTIELLQESSEHLRDCGIEPDIDMSILTTDSGDTLKTITSQQSEKSTPALDSVSSAGNFSSPRKKTVDSANENKGKSEKAKISQSLFSERRLSDNILGEIGNISTDLKEKANLKSTRLPSLNTPEINRKTVSKTTVELKDLMSENHSENTKGNNSTSKRNQLQKTDSSTLHLSQLYEDKNSLSYSLVSSTEQSYADDSNCTSGIGSKESHSTTPSRTRSNCSVSDVKIELNDIDRMEDELSHLEEMARRMEVGTSTPARPLHTINWRQKLAEKQMTPDKPNVLNRLASNGNSSFAERALDGSFIGKAQHRDKSLLGIKSNACVSVTTFA